ncbi:hypothetical protein [Abyssibius alkaniclasticus]|uniref:hypothetical protein n=1 Tax=Abyssibius alkaniclasticus TaxID=2881234 RepID=UPI0040588F7B
MMKELSVQQDDEDLNFDAVVELSIQIRKFERERTFGVIALIAVAALLGFLFEALVDLQVAMLGVVIVMLFTMRYEIMIYLMRCERAGIFRDNPQLIAPALEEVKTIMADKTRRRLYN